MVLERAIGDPAERPIIETGAEKDQAAEKLIGKLVIVPDAMWPVA